MEETKQKLRYADVAVNLGDPVFSGNYHGKQVHQSDLQDVIDRALSIGCKKLMVTGSDLDESRRATALAQQYPGVCYATVGVHPCQAELFERYPGGDQKALEELRAIASSAKEQGWAAAFGEIGLDYDRLQMSSKEAQLKYFEAQLQIAMEIQLPMFLHMRAAAADFRKLLEPCLEKLPRKGLVHSFTGTLEEMQELVALGLDIGVNGCSLRTEENCNVTKEIPLDHLQIETDAPWCEIRPSHASYKHISEAPPLPGSKKKEKWQSGYMVKGRNEPATIGQVAQIIAKLKDIPVEQVSEAAWRNSIRMFGLGENVYDRRENVDYGP